MAGKYLMTIPKRFGYPTVTIEVNNKKYTYPTGVETWVEDEASDVIEAALALEPQNDPTVGSGGGKMYSHTLTILVDNEQFIFSILSYRGLPFENVAEVLDYFATNMPQLSSGVTNIEGYPCPIYRVQAFDDYEITVEYATEDGVMESYIERDADIGFFYDKVVAIK